MSCSITVDDAARKLLSAASLATFESVDIATYRDTLSRSFQAAIAQLKRGHDRNHSGIRTFDNILSTGIPWTELLIYWQRRTQRASNDNVSPLEEVINLVMNPCVVPQALSTALAMAFFRVLVEDTTMAKSVSVNPLLHALRRLLDARPAARQVGKDWLEYIKSNLRLKADEVNSYNVERAHRLVSICKHLACHVDGAAILKCLLTLLHDIDDVDIQLLQTSRRKKKGMESPSCPCQQRNRRGRNWRRGLPAYDLDDDMNDEQDGSGIAVLKVELAGGGNFERVSRTAPHYPSAECEMCSIKKSSQGITQLPVQLVLLRSRVYKKILSIFSLTTTRNSEVELRNGHRRASGSKSLLSALVFLVYRNPQSASLRLCVALMAESLSRVGYKYLVEYLWVLYSQRPHRSDAALRIYAELLVDCSHFDDPNKCWEALQPLLNTVADSCETTMPDQLDAESTLRVCTLLRCLSFILRHRRHTLYTFEATHMWKKLISKVSLTFEDDGWWISSDMCEKEREETLSTLQAVGVLSFLVDDSASDNIETVGKNGSWRKETWPFPKTLRIRIAHRRMGPGIGKGCLLSHPNERLAHPPKPVLPRQSDKCAIGVPIMDYLNYDMLMTIFSFLGYKRLVKATFVSKTWKSLIESETMWRQAYVGRFPVQEGDKSIVASTNSPTLGSWKTLFVNKVLAEKALRFKRHSSGWKHRTCGYVGCLMVLRSPTQMATHYQTHEKRKRKLTGKKASGSKRTKLSSAA